MISGGFASFILPGRAESDTVTPPWWYLASSISANVERGKYAEILWKIIYLKISFLF
jgi:hypothetical protein